MNHRKRPADRIAVRRRYRAAAGIAVAIAALVTVPAQLGGAAPAPATELGASTLPADPQQRQRLLVDAATTVRDAPAVARAAGLTSVEIDDAGVIVRWKGGATAVPGPVADVIARAKRVVPVRVVPARHSRAEILAASAKIEKIVGGDPRFIGINAEPDGSGLVVKFDKADVSSKSAQGTLESGLPDVGMDASVAVEAAPQQISRLNDSAPWSGGARISNPAQGTSCTSGFGVSTPTGPAIATAAHCGAAGSRFTDGAGEFIGNVSGRNATYDIEIVPTSQVANTIYVGGRDSNTKRTVTGAGTPVIGEILCQSGNTSAQTVGGPVCNMRVLRENTDSQRLWVAQQLNGQQAARPGDSGGPVYNDRGDGTVLARGTSTAVGGANLYFGGWDKFVRDYRVGLPGGGTPPPPTGGVSLYTDCEYGTLFRTLDVGRYVVQSVNNRLSSIRVPAGYRVTLYDSDDLTGVSITRTADDGCLVNEGWNDRVGSILIERI